MKGDNLSAFRQEEGGLDRAGLFKKEESKKQNLNFRTPD